MKTRDIKDIIKNRGLERGTLFVLESQNEQIIALHRGLKDCAVAIDKVIDIVGTLVQVGENMKSTIEKVNKQVGEDRYELGDNTQMIGKDQ